MHAAPEDTAELVVAFSLDLDPSRSRAQPLGERPAVAASSPSLARPRERRVGDDAGEP